MIPTPEVCIWTVPFMHHTLDCRTGDQSIANWVWSERMSCCVSNNCDFWLYTLQVSVLTGIWKLKGPIEVWHDLIYQLLQCHYNSNFLKGTLAFMVLTKGHMSGSKWVIFSMSPSHACSVTRPFFYARTYFVSQTRITSPRCQDCDTSFEAQEH